MISIVLDVERVARLFGVSLKYGGMPLLRWVLHRPQRGASAGARLRLAFEELGLTYLKLGQFLTMRFDVLPAEVCAELDKLFEAVPPMPFEHAKRVIEFELGSPLEAVFPVFAREPI